MLLTFLMSFTGKLYWFTRLSAITAALKTILMVSGLLAIVALIVWFVINLSDPEYMTDEEEGKKRYLKLGSKALCIFTIVFVVGLVGRIFIPTTSEALLIYGVGESVEYLQNNKDAVQIPDKALQALNKYLDEVIEDKENNN